MLDLLQLGHMLDIDGDVLVTVEEVCDLAEWVTTLREATVRVWRDTDIGDRHLQMSARHESPPVRGVVTVWWRTTIVHTFWSALLDGEDLAVGAERELTCADVQAALHRTRMSVSREA